MEKLKMVQNIYRRLAQLADEREVARLNDLPTELIDHEMKHLREELKTILNQALSFITKEEV